MTTLVDLPALEEGDRVNAPLLVREVRQRRQANGDPYTVLTLGNSTGALESEPFWPHRQEVVRGIRAGHVVMTQGHVSLYRDRRQLTVLSLRVLTPESIDWGDLLPSVGSVDRFWEVLDAWRRDVAKPRLRAVLDAFYEADTFRHAYEQCPAAVRGHHAMLGGLLKHTVEVAAIGRTIARTSGADPDLVLAGALLHDIGKLETYRWDGMFRYTERGRLIGHVALGALMLENRLRETVPHPCTDAERDMLLHLVLSHHGRLEFGSPVVPATLEADVLHWADIASAKTTSFVDVLRDPEQFAHGEFSTPQWTLDHRRVYRGSSDWGVQDGEGRSP
ncbi:MAG TPA: HD domain-containing protein [Gemmatimonadales bacterium]